MLIYLCSSSHGYGHAARDAAVMQRLSRLRPEWTLVMSSGLPSPVLTLLLGDTAIQQRACQWDVDFAWGTRPSGRPPIVSWS